VEPGLCSILAPSLPPYRSALKAKPPLEGSGGALKSAALTAARHASLCSAIRIKPHSDRPSAHAGQRGDVYFSPENQRRFPVCRDLADAFKHPLVTSAIERETGTDLSLGHLRIEYCQDVDGFWLEPHVDIPVKLFTMLVYLSAEPELRQAGTDIYDATPEHNLVATAPYERNKGLIFIPGKDTWHGFSQRPINGVRKSIIINYVAPTWRDTFELA
jgi:hypothetical protein